MRVPSTTGNEEAAQRRGLTARAARERAQQAQTPVATTYAKEAANGRKERGQRVVLLAEDNIADVFLIQRAIELYRLPVNLIVAEDGEKALLFLDALNHDSAAPCPDVVLLDLNLPRRSGADVLQAVRTSERCPQVPVIVITSSDSQEDRDRAVQLGANYYFRKPNAYREFLQIGQIMKDYLALAERS